MLRAMPAPIGLRMMSGEHNSFEGVSAWKQAISPERLVASEVWSCLQNNNNNEYYLSLATGAYNNNNKNNRYYVVPIESDELIDVVFEAEADCWKNKHSSWDAAKYHYHCGRIWSFIDNLAYGDYEIWKSICFVVLYPKPREIFAAHYRDRIAHHIICPYMRYIAECVHKSNGDVSFGNRKRMSAWHACLRVQELMRRHPNGYIATFDVRSFFMSIDKDVAWNVYLEYEERYRPDWIGENMVKFILNLTKMMIYHNPATNCERKSPDYMWSFIAQTKSLFYMCGIPIGNYYAQLIANLILALVCTLLGEYDIAEFVDDFISVIDTVAEFHKVEEIFRFALSLLKLEQSMNKVYIQPVRHGVLWCGYVIRPNRMYVSNRPIRNCYAKIQEAQKEVNLYNARSLMCSVNSYAGMLCHCAEYNTSKAICSTVMHSGYRRYLYFRRKSGMMMCSVRRRYTRRQMSMRDIESVDNYVKTFKY